MAESAELAQDRKVKKQRREIIIRVVHAIIRYVQVVVRSVDATVRVVCPMTLQTIIYDCRPAAEFFIAYPILQLRGGGGGPASTTPNSENKWRETIIIQIWKGKSDAANFDNQRNIHTKNYVSLSM